MLLFLAVACAAPTPEAAGVRVSLNLGEGAELAEGRAFTVRDADDSSISGEVAEGDSLELALSPGLHALYALAHWEDPAHALDPLYVGSSCQGSVDVVVPEEGFAEVTVPVTCGETFEEAPVPPFSLPDGTRSTCNWADSWGILPDGRAWELHLALPREDFEAHEDVAYDLPLDGSTARLRIWDDSTREDTLTFAPCSDVEQTWIGRALEVTGNVRLAARSNGLAEDCDTWTYAGAFAFGGLATEEGPVTVPSFEGTLGFFGGCYGR